MNNNTIYTDEETELLKLTKKVRVDALNNLVKNGPPDKTNELRVMNELATSLDKLVTDSANARLKHQDTQNNAELADLVRQTLINSRQKKLVSEKDRTIPKDKTLDSVVPGQTEMLPTPLDPSEFIDVEE